MKKKSIFIILCITSIICISYSTFYAIKNNIINEYKAIHAVKSTILPIDDSISLGYALKTYQYFDNIKWNANTDKNGYITVKMTADLKINEIKQELISTYDIPSIICSFLEDHEKSKSSMSLDPRLIFEKSNNTYFLPEWLSDKNNNVSIEIEYKMNRGGTKFTDSHLIYIVDKVKGYHNKYNPDYNYIYKNEVDPSFTRASIISIDNKINSNIAKTIIGYYIYKDIENTILVHINESSCQFIILNKKNKSIPNEIKWNYFDKNSIITTKNEYSEIVSNYKFIEGIDKIAFTKVYPRIFYNGNILFEYKDIIYTWKSTTTALSYNIITVNNLNKIKKTIENKVQF